MSGPATGPLPVIIFSASVFIIWVLRATHSPLLVNYFGPAHSTISRKILNLLNSVSRVHYSRHIPPFYPAAIFHGKRNPGF
jgi:hypothetical protein